MPPPPSSPTPPRAVLPSALFGLMSGGIHFIHKSQRLTVCRFSGPVKRTFLQKIFVWHLNFKMTRLTRRQFYPYNVIHLASGGNYSQICITFTRFSTILNAQGRIKQSQLTTYEIWAFNESISKRTHTNYHNRSIGVYSRWPMVLSVAPLRLLFYTPG